MKISKHSIARTLILTGSLCLLGSGAALANTPIQQKSNGLYKVEQGQFVISSSCTVDVTLANKNPTFVKNAGTLDNNKPITLVTFSSQNCPMGTLIYGFQDVNPDDTNSGFATKGNDKIKISWDGATGATDNKDGSYTKPLVDGSHSDTIIFAENSNSKPEGQYSYNVAAYVSID